MKKLLIMALSLLLITSAAQSKARWGIRGGFNITKMSFDDEVLSSSNRTGFYIGPTLKVPLALGLGLDISAIYDQREANVSCEKDNNDAVFSNGSDLNTVNLTRKNFSLPLNLRYSIGLGSALNIFVFAGPQLDLCLNKDIKETNFNYSWTTSTCSVNLGFGLTVASHVELRANYNIPCGNTGTFTLSNALTETGDGVKNKTGAWQLGAAIYF